MDKDDREELESESRFTRPNREKKELVTLGGTALTRSGKITKTEYFRFLGHDLDNYDQIALTPQEAKKIHTHLQKLSTGTSAMVPLFCGGDRCPFKDRCPLFAMDKHPLGKQCLIESQLLKEYTIRYIEEFDVNPNNFTEVGYVNELAAIDIKEMRLNMALARPENAELVIDQVTALTPNGTPIIQKQASPYMEQLEKLQARRSKIIKLMVGDRQEKYKEQAALKIQRDLDSSSKMAAMHARLEELQRSMDTIEVEIESKEKYGELTPQDIIDGRFKEE